MGTRIGHFEIAIAGCLGLVACHGSGGESASSAAGGGKASSSASGGSGGASSSSSTTASASAGTSTSSGTATSSTTSGTGGASTTGVGTWVDVTPSNASLVLDPAGCGNYGVQTVGVDPANPANLYASFNCQGIWKSTDYGQTWKGPLNNSMTSAGAGGVTVARGAAGTPVLYVANIRGNVGFYASTDDGVTWTNYNIAPAAAGRQDVYPPVVDPYDAKHLLMAGHEQDLLVESTDGGKTWTNVAIASGGGALNGGGMNENGGTASIFFIDTGVASTTRTTFLWLAQQAGGMYGTWRTTNGGTTWTQVDLNEHAHGCGQIYQPGGSVVYMAGAYSTLGWGVLRSTDLGQTWAHAGGTGNENQVFGTPSTVYATYGWACNACNLDPSLEVVAQPGTGTWTPAATPAAMATDGGGAQAAVTFDGTHHDIVLAAWDTGLWRYVEP